MQDPTRQSGEEYDADNEGSVSVKYTENVAGKAHVVPNKKLYDLSTLRTVAQKHQTLRTINRFSNISRFSDFHSLAAYFGMYRLDKMRSAMNRGRFSK